MQFPRMIEKYCVAGKDYYAIKSKLLGSHHFTVNLTIDNCFTPVLLTLSLRIPSYDPGLDC